MPNSAAPSVNPFLGNCQTSDGGAPFQIVRGPVQFNHEPPETTRAPKASEHIEVVLVVVGIDWDRIEKLKDLGAIA